MRGANENHYFTDNPEEEAKPRKEKICIYCKHYDPPTERMEAECKVDEDIYESDYCESYEYKYAKD